MADEPVPPDPNATLPPPEEDPGATLPPPDDPDGSPTLTSAGSNGTRTHFPTPVTSIPGYVIEGELGRGGMGVVYKARQTGLNRPVALKMVLAADQAEPKELVRFLAEAEAVAAVKHPHVVQVYGFGEHEGRPYLAMEYLDGGSLAELLQRAGRLPPRDAAALVERLARAVQAAHDLGIVHRDLKPANILFATDAGPRDGSGTDAPSATTSHYALHTDRATLSPRVTDFGLAKRGSHDLTRTGAIMGSPAYMSPEQAKGQTKFVGPAADVYALGVVLYECLAGTVPFKAEDTVALIMKVAEEDPDPVRKHTPTAPRDLELICLKCLAKDPKKRYPTAAALADDLRRFQDGESISARPATVPERTGRWVRKNPARATAVAAAVVFVAVGIGVIVYDSRAQQRRADELQKLSDQALQSANTAREQKAAADVEKERAKAAEQQAKQAREDTVDQLYAASIDLAYREWQQNNIYRSEQLLNETPPPLRGWEWRFLKSLTRQEAHILRGHLSAVNDLAVSADGTRLVSADGSWRSRLWDLTSGQELLAADTTWGPFAFSPDNRTAFAVVNHSPKLTGRPDGRVIRSLPTEQVAAAVFTDGGKHLVTLSAQTGRATKWSVATGEKVADLPAKLPANVLQTWAVGRPRLSADGKQAAYRHGLGQIDVWDLTNVRNNQYTFQGTPMHADAIGFHPNGILVAGGFADGTVYLWDVTTKKEVRRIHGHDGAVRSLAFSPDGKRLATGGADTVAKVWDVATGTEMFAFRGHTAEVQTVTFTPDGKRVVTGSSDGSIRVWNLIDTRHRGASLGLLQFIVKNRTAEELPLLMPQGSTTHGTYYGHLGPTRGLAFSPDGRQIATTGRGDRSATVWDLEANKEVAKYGYYSNGVGAVAFSRDGKRIAVVGQTDWNKNPGRLFVYDVGRDDPVMKADLAGEGTADVTPAVVFAPDGKHVVVCLTGKVGSQVRVFEVVSGKPVAALPQDGQTVHTLAFTPDGKRLVVGAAARVRGYDWPARTTAFDHPRNMTTSLAVGSGGRIAVGYSDSRIDLFDPDDLTNSNQEKRLEGHVGTVHSVAFSPDGSRLVSTGNEMAVKVWDAKSGKELLTFREHSGLVSQVGWSPDGRRVASCGHDALKVWTVPVEDRDSTESWKLLYAERFDDPGATKGWKNLGPNWVVEDGALRGTQQVLPNSSAGWSATAAPPTGPLPRTVEVRYTMWSPAPRIAGMTLYNPRTDLAIQPLFGAPGNRMGRLGAFVLVVQKSRGGMTDSGVPRDKFPFEPNRKYHVRVLRDKTRLSVTVNGEHVLTETVVAGEAPGLTLSSSWGQAGDPIFFDDIEVRAPAAAVAERKLFDRFDAWCDELLVRDLVAERIERTADLSPADKQILKALVPTLTENPATILEAVAKTAYRPDLPPADAAVAAEQAQAVLRLEPGNWPALFFRGLAEYRAGRLDAAEATMRKAIEIRQAEEGSASPNAASVLALVYHKKNKPAEARAWLRRAKDLTAGEGWTGTPNVADLIAEADAAIKPPPDPDGDAIRKVVFTSMVRGWLHADLDAYLSAYADDARVTLARSKEPSDQDVTFDKARLAVVRAVAFPSTAAWKHRNSYENADVRVTGDRAEMAFTATNWTPWYYGVWANERTLRRTPGGWIIVTDRSWQLAEKQNDIVTQFGPEFFKSADADASAARKNGDGAELVESLLRARRYRDAAVAAREQAAKPGATADDMLRLANAAYNVSEVAEAMTAFRAALAAKPDLETPWFLTRERKQLQVSPQVVYGLARHPTRPEIAAGAGLKVTSAWDLGTRRERWSDSSHIAAVSDVQYSPDGRFVASVGNEGLLKLRDADTGAEVWSVQAHSGMGFRLAFRPGGRQIVSCGFDGRIRITDAGNGQLVREWVGHADRVYGVAWSPDGGRVASASTDGTARVWDPETGTQRFIARGHAKGVMRVIFSPDGATLATSGLDATVRLWDAHTGDAKATLAGGHTETIEPIAFTPDGRTLASGGTRDGNVVLWDVQAGKVREVLRVARGGGVFGLVISKDGKELMTAATDGTVRVWTLAPW